tara:strand:+ start:517 stop:717 length:201 start_codon:yes stop_codon:yes gene_type:complete
MEGKCVYDVTDEPDWNVDIEYGGDNAGGFYLAASYYSAWELYIFESLNVNQLIYTLYWVENPNFEK